MNQGRQFKFAQKLRIHKDADYSAIFKGEGAGRRYKTQYFAFFTKPNSFGHPRLGVIISKKNVHNAVERNRLRRIIRETFRLKQHELKFLDIVFHVYKNADKLSNYLWRDSIRRQLVKLIQS